ncbi:MAG TPA: flagellar basal-body rod protein FlgF [Bradyrhizobium sp.]
MDSTLLISLSHQMAATRSMDVIANNLANVSTNAYQREEPTFKEFMSYSRPPEGQLGQQSMSFVTDTGTVRDLSEGSFQATGSRYDLAVHGNGYFKIGTAKGTVYTRDGHFSLDGDGNMVDSNGNKLQGDGGPITVTPDDGDVHIADDGTVSGKNGQIGQIKLATFANPRLMQKIGNNYYSTTEQPTDAPDAKIVSGMLESSNVSPVVEISHMIEVMRAYQASTTLAQSHETLMRQAIQQLGAQPQA